MQADKIYPNRELIMNKESRITEQSSLYDHLEEMSVEELTAHINTENKKVALAIEQALPAINRPYPPSNSKWSMVEDSSMPVAELGED